MNRHLLTGRFHIKIWFLTSLKKKNKTKNLTVLGLHYFVAAISQGEAACLRWGKALYSLSLSPALHVVPPILSCFVHVCCLPGSYKHLDLPPLIYLKKAQEEIGPWIRSEEPCVQS